ncbi:MAG TPA: efflux RND transporter periplasmic adaptor subunit [Candidatus Binataceae bacterium]|nr:efflux RND transporter periplasmic adaptor subunit [Candidatus Binataceae bacterium]
MSEPISGDLKNYQPHQPGRFYLAGWIILIIVVLCATIGLILVHGSRLRGETADRANELALGPRVLVAQVGQAPQTRTLELPGTIHGFIETPVYAKVAGYLKSIKVDKGDRVHTGELLATLESPELDHQVANAIATYRLAQVTDRRNQELLRSGVIARQTADETHANLLETKATLDQLAATRDYEQIRAPMDGVVTARYVDPGALIPQSTAPTSANTALIALATLSPLRIYADVPQSVAPFVKDGDAATITVTEYPGRVFEGNVTRHPQALTSATRTMLIEVDLPNDDHALLPGMYAKLNFRATVPEGPPLVPDDALVFRDGKPFVPLVQDNRLRLAAVALGYDDGINVEVTKGVAAQDLVALNVGQAARDGEPVRPMTAEQAQ